MNKIIASTGLVVVGVSSLQASSFYAPAPELTPKEQAKPWSVSATLQGFYDSNVLQTPDDDPRGEVDSWGLIVGVGAGLDMAMEQTYLAVRYDYKYHAYFESDLENDHNHAFNFRFDHTFTEDLELDVRDNLVISREPEVLQSGGIIGAPITRRSDRSALRNTGNVDVLYSFSDQYGAGVGYENDYYTYDDPGFESLLDRVEQKISLDGRWKNRPDLTLLAGYQYGWVNYQSNIPLPSGNSPDTRNRNSHYGFVGGDYQISSTLMASGRAGFNYSKYPNAPAGADDTTTTPYVDISGTWNYNEGSYIQTGFKYDLASTDIYSADPTDPTFDIKAFVWYGIWAHALTPKIVGKVNWQTQFGEVNGGKGGAGSIDGDKENLYLVGAGIDYIFNEWWKANLNYSYTSLDSDLFFRSFNRHRVSFGVTASY